MSDIAGCTHGLRKRGQSIHDLFGSFVSEFFMREIMVVDSESQTFLGQSLVNLLEHASASVTGNILHSENLAKTNRPLELASFFNGGWVVGNAANSGLV